MVPLRAFGIHGAFPLPQKFLIMKKGSLDFLKILLCGAKNGSLGKPVFLRGSLSALI